MFKKPIHKHDQYSCVVPPMPDGTYEGIAFAFPDCQTATNAFQGKIRRYMYHGTNEGNPTVREFEKKMTVGEASHASHRYDALASASGMAAIDILTRQLVLPGKEVVSSPFVYGGIYNYFANYLPMMGASCHFVEKPNNTHSWEAAISERTAFLFLETPANPTSFVFDIAAISAVAKNAGVPLVVDNTVPTHALQKPLQEGADIVIVSTSKGVNGASNGLGGVIVGIRDFIQITRDSWGATVRPVMDSRCAKVMLQGLETLEWRMQRSSANALKIAEWLARQSKVKLVNYPLLSPKPFRKIVERQMPNGAGPLLSFEVNGSWIEAWKWLDETNRLILAPHIGHSKTIVIHPATTTHWRVPCDMQAKLGITSSLIRMSVGTENDAELDLLFEEMEQLFAKI